jgi:hypothetical protein
MVATTDDLAARLEEFVHQVGQLCAHRRTGIAGIQRHPAVLDRPVGSVTPVYKAAAEAMASLFCPSAFGAV